MIFIGLGGNLSSWAGSPLQTCTAALSHLERGGVNILRCSYWYKTEPVPSSDQPWFVNAVAEVQTQHNPRELLHLLHSVEELFERERSTLNEARTLDLDLLAFHGLVWGPGESPPILPHPRLHMRAFVLLPMLDIAPEWRHPVLGETTREMSQRLASDHKVLRLC
ncbi:MAG: 2-amino-4-hydroxy-6-hydroxymethyldihydropteridine diphosphokinase [Candidatus Marinimicrobia bacterium]|nr:2-amino-4-hydroxy-6-hydroxymethyldihydropteridine diphosphokinase [Candidatus Neomarinimicrobiota bacterium]